MNRVAVLRLGTSRVDKGAAVVAEVPLGTFVVTPVHAYVIELADGRNVLVDTGMSPIYIKEPHYGFDPDFAAILTPVMTPEDRLEAQLAGVGLRPDDISSVISTHLHFDHAGNNGLFGHGPDLHAASPLRSGARQIRSSRTSTGTSRTCGTSCWTATRSCSRASS